jgi:hypothetical protein
MEELDKLTTREELAEYLRVSLFTVDMFIKNGDGPPTVKVGRKRYFTNVNAWLRARTAQQAAAKARKIADKAEAEAKVAEAAARQSERGEDEEADAAAQ